MYQFTNKDTETPDKTYCRVSIQDLIHRVSNLPSKYHSYALPPVKLTSAIGKAYLYHR